MPAIRHQNIDRWMQHVKSLLGGKAARKGPQRDYPLVHEQLESENHQVLVETPLPFPMSAKVYVNLLEGILLTV